MCFGLWARDLAGWKWTFRVLPHTCRPRSRLAEVEGSMGSPGQGETLRPYCHPSLLFEEKMKGKFSVWLCPSRESWSGHSHNLRRGSVESVEILLPTQWVHQN